MAIFYNHIKGCGANTTGTGTDAGSLTATTEDGREIDESWGWITWPNKLKYVKNDKSTGGVADFRYRNNCPELRFNNINTKPNTTILPSLSLGKFIVSDARYQYISRLFYFYDGLQINNNLAVTKTVTIGADWENNAVKTTTRTIELSGRQASTIGVDRKHNVAFTRGATLYFFNTKVAPPTDTDTNPNTWEGDFGAIYRGDDSFIIESTKAKRTGRLPGYFAFSKITIINSETDDDAELIVKGKSEALYFNATSDRRAKNNITPAKFSALHVVNSIPTYTFNYNNKEEKTIGLIAQEAAEFDLDGFNMVDNLEATGQNGDFMQMKESKLVYVLWKAVQELSAEVEELKTQIASLK